MFPAKYKNVLSVIARDIDNVDDPNSNKSTEKKSFSAPGIHIITKEGKLVSGSSIAALYLSGSIGIVKSTVGNLDNKTIIDAFEDTSDDKTSFSYGLIRLDKVLKKLQ